MPFEPYQTTSSSSTILPIADRLAAIGVTPVDREIVYDYIREVKRRDTTYGQWAWRMIPNDRLIRSLRKPRLITRRLGWLSAAPLRVRRLAAFVQDQLPEAQFALHYFASDPYLTVFVHHFENGDGVQNQATLAIWQHRFNLVAIADRH